MLLDTGTPNYFIVFKMVQDLCLMPQNLKVALNVVSPLGAMVTLGKVFKGYPLTLPDRNFLPDLIVLLMKEFNVILGID